MFELTWKQRRIRLCDLPKLFQDYRYRYKCFCW